MNSKIKQYDIYSWEPIICSLIFNLVSFLEYCLPVYIITSLFELSSAHQVNCQAQLFQINIKDHRRNFTS